MDREIEMLEEAYYVDLHPLAASPWGSRGHPFTKMLRNVLVIEAAISLKSSVVAVPWGQDWWEMLPLRCVLLFERGGQDPREEGRTPGRSAKFQGDQGAVAV